MPAVTDSLPDTPWYVYIVRCLDETYYTGITTDLKRRLAEHNAGSGAKYTRSRRPVVLLYFEPARSRSEAAKREFRIKRLSPAAKRHLVEFGAGLSQGSNAPPDVPRSGP